MRHRLHPALRAAASAAACLALAAACGRGAPADSTASALDASPRDALAGAHDALGRDLALAGAAGAAVTPETLAPRTRFVSPLEAGVAPERLAPRQARTPARRQRTTRAATLRTPEAVAPRPAPPAPRAERAVASAPAPEAPAPAPVVVASGPSAADAPAPAADPGPTRVGDGGHGDAGHGDGTGVVIRGGGVGDVDHCERDLPGTWGGRIPGGGVLVGRRMPGDAGRVGGAVIGAVLAGEGRGRGGWGEMIGGGIGRRRW
jgi:hypothetical protein